MNCDAPDLARGEWIVVETMRGHELALLGGALSTEQEQRYRISCRDDSSDGHIKGGEPALQEVTFVRKSGAEDHMEAEKCREEENAVLLSARNILREHDLSMKLVDVEFILDKKKLFFYFTSEQRVDFRAYVRDLAKEFKTRIELRQIGVRDEAKTIRGLGPCGEVCCCSYWLHRFTPICIKMVKEQNLALNPTKISGICGRLMCCMSFEHTLYGKLWKSLPNPGSKIRSPDGTYILDGMDLSAEAVRVRCPGGKSVLVKIEDFPRFKETVLEGKPWEEDASPQAQKNSPDGSWPQRRRRSDGQGRAQSALSRDVKGAQPSGRKEASAPPQEGGAAESQPSEMPAKKKKRRKKSQPRKNPAQAAQSAPDAAEQQTGEPVKRADDEKKGGQKRSSGSRRRRPHRKETREAAPSGGEHHEPDGR